MTSTLTDSTLSVNEVLRRWPAAVRVMNAFGVDTCCGGARSLDEAAADAGIPIDDLVFAINASRAANRPPEAGLP